MRENLLGLKEHGLNYNEFEKKVNYISNINNYKFSNLERMNKGNFP